MSWWAALSFQATLALGPSYIKAGGDHETQWISTAWISQDIYSAVTGRLRNKPILASYVEFWGGRDSLRKCVRDIEMTQGRESACEGTNFCIQQGKCLLPLPVLQVGK